MSIETFQMWVIIYYVAGIFVTAAILAVSRKEFTDFEIASTSLFHPIFTILIICFGIPMIILKLYIVALRKLMKKDSI